MVSRSCAIAGEEAWDWGWGGCAWRRRDDSRSSNKRKGISNPPSGRPQDVQSSLQKGAAGTAILELPCPTGQGRDRLGVPSLLHFSCKNSRSKELPWHSTILPHPWERASAQSTKYFTLLPSGSTQTIPCWLSTPPGCIPQVLCSRWQRSPQGARLLFFRMT